MRAKKISEPESCEGVGQLLNLSLFVMLLAFFIVLSAFSTFDADKVEPVMASLESTFTSVVQAEGDAPSIIQDPDQGGGEGNSIDRIEALFKAQIPGASYEKNEKDGTMTARLPFDRFLTQALEIKASDMSAAGPQEISEENLFLPMLVAVLKTEEEGHVYQMDMLLEIEQNPSVEKNTNPQGLQTDVNRIGQVAQTLQREGVPEHLMSIGLSTGEQGMIHILFRPYERLDPVQPKENPLEATIPAISQETGP